MNENKLKYSTKQRKQILMFLAENADRCFTVRDLINESGLTVGEATVYRTLSAFAEEGSVKKYITGSGKGAIYQYNSCNTVETHFHLRCMKCGKLFHTECEVIEEMVEHIHEHHGFRVDAVHTTMYGICRDCDTNDGKDKDKE